MNVRAARRDDAQAWALCRARLWPDAEPAELGDEVRAFLDGTGTPLIAAAFVAEDGAEMRGFIELAIRPFADGCDSSPVAHVEGWFVEPSVRGRGVGSSLMAAAEAWARARGFRELASDTQIHNEDSLAAHLACGFSETERLIKLRKPLN